MNATDDRVAMAARTVAEEYGINAEKFVNFWTERFGRYSPGYMREWAQRIAQGRATFIADDDSLAALEQAGLVDAEAGA